MPYPAQIVDKKWLPKESGAFRYLEAVSPDWRQASAEESEDTADDPNQPRFSRDIILNALAQLGATRLGVKRAMISIVTRSEQYVIAEATQTISLNSKSDHDVDDGIWMGCCSLPTAGGLCQWTVSQADRVREAIRNSGIGDEQRCFVSNLAEDDRFKDAPFVTGPPFARFYAGAPIIAKSSGKTFGSYCVFDDRPNHSFSAEAVQLMVDMASAVADHLELIRIKLERSRSEKMVRGIGSFIEGKASIREWWALKRTELARSELDPLRNGKSVMSPAAKEKESPKAHRAHSPISPTDNSKIHSTSPKFDDQASPHESAGKGKKLETPAPLTQSSTAKDIRGLFTRGSNIIREAAELEGIIFIDANFAGRRSDDSKLNKNDSSSPATTSGEDVPALPRDEAVKPCTILGYSTVDGSSIDPADTAHNITPVDERLLRSLLHRYPNGKIFNFDEFSSSDSDTTSAVSEEPEDITVSDMRAGRTESEAGRPKRRLHSKIPRKSDMANLARILPGARSVAFFPLWDPTKGCWYAGAIAYTNQVLRVLSSEGELSYLAAFGNSIMAEVSRMVAVRDDRAKSDFISSISHELRSPLHGILGNAEFLKGTQVDALQADMVHSIETCGRTLLDTVNHLLDYAKINNFLRSGAKGGMIRRASGFPRAGAEAKANPKAWMMSLESDLDVAVLTEGVVQSAFAGHDFYTHSSSTHYSDSITSSSIHPDLQAISQHHQPTGRKRLSVILNIQPAHSYVFRAQAGALRRVLMNACGNALKYTTSGFVYVELLCKRLPTTSSTTGDVSEITLAIQDSGKGISKAYLRDRLFTPFAQEDPYSPGTGLGLSIVKQITKSLHGSIDVQSEVGVGTMVKISLKLKHPESEPDAAQQHDAQQPVHDRDGVLHVAEQVKGWRVCIFGFSRASGAIASGTSARKREVIPEAEKKREAKAVGLLQKSLKTMCESWFGMKVVYGFKDANGVGLDMHITTLAASSDYWIRSGFTIPDELFEVVVCPDSDFAAHATEFTKTRNSAKNMIFVVQPLGPVKFAMVLSTLLQRRADRQSHESPSHVAEKQTLPERPAPQPTADSNPDAPPLAQQLAHDILLASPATQQLVQGILTKGQQTTLASAQTPGTQDTTLQPAAPGVRLLLVEDNHINLQLLVAFCKKQSATYTTATNGLEALEAYKAARGAFDCVLMDISMPVMDGMESTREIRRYESEQGLKPTSVVALTGLASETAQDEAFGSGVDLFLTKPVRLEELKEFLRTTIDAQGKA